MSCVALKDYPSATFSGFVKRFRPKNTKESYAKYMGFYLRDKYFRKLVTNNAFMTLRASFNEAIFNNLKIYLPCYEEQVVIGNFLYVLNLKIKNNNKIISELEKHTRLIYDYWFLQFDFPNECGMPYKSSGGKMVWCDELMMDIPEGWKISNVTSILKRMPKTEGILTTEYQMSGCIPIIDQSMKFIAGFTNDESYLIPCTEPIIVFGDHTKIIKFINFPFARGADGTKLIQSNDKRMPSLLLYLNLLHANIHHQGYSRHFKYIKDLLLLLPDEKIADEFTNIADVNYQEIRVLIKENIELAALRDYLQPLLMNGQISFKDKQETVV
jgi:type I restriction enzyme S subunit